VRLEKYYVPSRNVLPTIYIKHSQPQLQYLHDAMEKPDKNISDIPTIISPSENRVGTGGPCIALNITKND
jgi:hypothetical protein